MTDLTLDLGLLLPALVPLAGVLLVLLVDLAMPTLRRAPAAVALVAALGTAAAVVPTLGLGPGDTVATLCLAGAEGDLLALEGLPRTCLWTAGPTTATLQLAAALAAALCIALAWPPRVPRAHDGADGTGATSGPATEPVAAVLALTALAGTVVVAASRDVGTWLVALELATLPVVGLVALPGTRRAVAGAVELLLVSITSFALLVLGMALWLGATGSPFLEPAAALAAESGTGERALVLGLSVVLVVVGLAFKLSLVPFHAWTPTAYAGSTLPVAAFLATVSKLAALAALLVVLRAITVLGTSALLAVAVLAALSMTLGNVMALRQDDVVRLLAWSTVAQAGWVVMPLVAASSGGERAAATYLLTYVLATAVAFAVVASVARTVGRAGRTLEAYAGLWRRSPWRAGALAVALTSLAGLPPGILGLVGKVVALRPVVAEGWVWLTLVAAANAVLGVAVYLRWLRPVLLGAPSVEAGAPAVGEGAVPAPAAAPASPRRPVAVLVALAASAALLVVVSVQPELVLGLLGR